jgi:hypothetical protein
VTVLLLMVQCGCTVPSERFLDFPSKSAELPCNSNGTCKVTVYAKSDSTTHCTVMAETKLVRVASDRTPTLLWELNSLDSGHPYDYRFSIAPEPQGYGIDIVGNTPQNFTNPGYGTTFIVITGKKKFKWADVHGRPVSLDYELHVVRSPHNQDDWSTSCGAIDPKIAND